MTYLKIRDGKGLFLNKQAEEVFIDNISKDDLLYLLDEATKAESSFEMDEPVEGSLQNAAHKIIYEALYKKFIELLRNKDRFLDESNHLYEEAFRKYKSE